jgi:hypothetical protein
MIPGILVDHSKTRFAALDPLARAASLARGVPVRVDSAVWLKKSGTGQVFPSMFYMMGWLAMGELAQKVAAVFPSLIQVLDCQSEDADLSGLKGLNIIQVADCIDRERSELRYFRDCDRICSISRLVIKVGSVGSEDHVFRIGGLLSCTLVTDWGRKMLIRLGVPEDSFDRHFF